MSEVLASVIKNFNSAVIQEVPVNSSESCLLIEKNNLIEILTFLKKDKSTKMVYLSDINAVDYPEREKRFDVNYHLYSIERKERLHLKIQVSEGEKVPSVTKLWEGAFYPETEIYDLFGISFDGNDFEKRLFLPQDFQGFPLRKDFINPWEDIAFK